MVVWTSAIPDSPLQPQERQLCSQYQSYFGWLHISFSLPKMTN